MNDEQHDERRTWRPEQWAHAAGAARNEREALLMIGVARRLKSEGYESIAAITPEELPPVLPVGSYDRRESDDALLDARDRWQLSILEEQLKALDD